MLIFFEEFDDFEVFQWDLQAFLYCEDVLGEVLVVFVVHRADVPDADAIINV